MSLPLKCLTAACWVLSGAAAVWAARRLRCWFFSALEFTQAVLLEKSARIPVLPALWLRGYFDQDRVRLIWVFLGGWLLPVLSVLIRLIFGETAGTAGTAGLLAVQGIPFAGQLVSRVKGIDGKRHERFNRYAPLKAADRARAAREARKTRLTAPGRRFFPEKTGAVLSGANTARDEALLADLARF